MGGRYQCVNNPKYLNLCNPAVINREAIIHEAYTWSYTVPHFFKYASVSMAIDVCGSGYARASVIHCIIEGDVEILLKRLFRSRCFGTLDDGCARRNGDVTRINGQIGDLVGIIT